MKNSFKIIIICLLSICLFGCNDKKIDREKELNVFEFTTKEGTNITFEYLDFDGYSIKVPQNFSLMSDEIKKIKYPNGNAPKLIYTNSDATINLNLENNEVKTKEEQIIEYTNQMEKALTLLGEVKSVEYFKRDNHQIGELKFVSKAIDTEIFNHMILFSINGKLKIVSFNCTVNYYEEYEPVSDLIINSIKFN